MMVNFDYQLIGLKMARRLVSYVCEDSSIGREFWPNDLLNSTDSKI